METERPPEPVAPQAEPSVSDAAVRWRHETQWELHSDHGPAPDWAMVAAQTMENPAEAFQAPPPELRWDAHLAEVFEEADRLRGQDGEADDGLHLIYVAYAMSRMISVAPFLQDAGLEASVLRQSLRRRMADIARTAERDATRDDRFDDLITNMQTHAAQSGARKVGIAHLITAFESVGVPLAGLAAGRTTRAPRRDVHAARDAAASSFADKPVRERSTSHAPADAETRQPGETNRGTPLPARNRHQTSQRSNGPRRFFRDPRQLSFRGLTPEMRRANSEQSAAGQSACKQLSGEVGRLQESTRQVGDVLSRLDRRLAAFDQRLEQLERSSARQSESIRAFQTTRSSTSGSNGSARAHDGDNAHRRDQEPSDRARTQPGRGLEHGRSSARSSSSLSQTRSSSSRSTRTRQRNRRPRRTGLSWIGLTIGRKPGSLLTRFASSSRGYPRRNWSDRQEREPRRDHDRVNREQTERGKRFYLALDDDVVDAPSIGPKTADRLRPNGIYTVRDLLDADAETLAAATDGRHITAASVRDWQTQSRLVITIPWLRGTHAQLLVGAGFENAGEIAKASDAEVMAAILRYAATREGQRILRDGPPPAQEKVADWVENARQAEPERAA